MRAFQAFGYFCGAPKFVVWPVLIGNPLSAAQHELLNPWSYDEKNDVKDAQTQEEEAEPSKVFGKGCVLNDDRDDAQRIIKTIIESDETFVPKDEDKKDADGSDKKPCCK
ncbi:hypothetical protein PGT21_022630 [Puccinia graminis f. sp. tritici]|uniref:Uncharacterized protein n=1 Tax=Puccinia graminis f. sp. tritici TaxID=56615 RepID=A0A5B0M4J5_PUCGR|nr:hypothetical protein PGT21_022630 [Puccinia graminis f. sp. tritici]